MTETEDGEPRVPMARPGAAVQAMFDFAAGGCRGSSGKEVARMDLEVTERQRALIERIEDVLGITFEGWCEDEGRRETKYSASAFIDRFLERYREECGFGRD